MTCQMPLPECRIGSCPGEDLSEAEIITEPTCRSREMVGETANFWLSRLFAVHESFAPEDVVTSLLTGCSHARELLGLRPGMPARELLARPHCEVQP